MVTKELVARIIEDFSLDLSENNFNRGRDFEMLIWELRHDLHFTAMVIQQQDDEWVELKFGYNIDLGDRLEIHFNTDFEIDSDIDELVDSINEQEKRAKKFISLLQK